MRWLILTALVALSLGAAAAGEDPAATDDGTTDANRSSFTQGAPAQDRAGHAMDYSTKEPDLDRRPSANQQVNVTGVVEARAPGSQIICKNSPIIGSRLSTRLCLPLSRWKQMHADAQQMVRDGQAASHYGGAEIGFSTP